MRTTIVRVLGTLAVLAVLLGLTTTAAQAAPAGATALPMTVTTAAAVTSTDYCGTPSTAWVPDGWGKANFRSACALHDTCYSATSTTDRRVCDSVFLTRLRSACASAYGSWNPLRYTCDGVAWIYYETVRSLGAYAYTGQGSRA